MAEDNRARLKQWLESGEVRLQPLALPQRELWEASPVAPGDVANHICCFIHVKGGLTPAHCEAAVQRVVDRQEALRISFLPGKERPLQLVRAAAKVNFAYRELSAAEAQPEALEELGREIFRQPFDMLQGPLYRVVMLRRAADDYVLVFAIHHAIADGWTLGVFVQDLCAAYVQVLMGNRTPMAPVPMSYTDWGAAERAFWQPVELAQRLAFWRPHLADRTTLWTPPSTAAGCVPARWVSHVPAALTAAARDLARRNGATLFSTLLAAFQNTIAEWTGVDDVLVGSPVANRTRQTARETMGYCAGIVPLRGQVARGETFVRRIGAVHRNTVDCLANAMPFVELMHGLGERPSPGRNPVFQVRFALQNHPIPDVTLPGLSARLRMRSTGTARFDLGCEITEEGERLELVWLSRADLFPAQDVETLDRQFQTVLADGCRASERRATHLVT